MKKIKNLIFNFIAVILICGWAIGAYATQRGQVDFDGNYTDPYSGILFRQNPSSSPASQILTYVDGHTGSCGRSSHNADDGGTDLIGSFTNGDPFYFTDECYVSYWIMFEEGYDGLCDGGIRNIKQIWFDGGAGIGHLESIINNVNGTLNFLIQGGGDISYVHPGDLVDYVSTPYTRGQWAHIEHYIKLSTGATHSNSDGIWRLWVNSNLIWETTNAITGSFAGGGVDQCPALKASCDAATGEGWWRIDDYEYWDSMPDAEEDTTAPTQTSATIGSNGTLVTVAHSETVVTTGYDNGDYHLDCSVSGEVALNTISGSGSTRTFTAASAILEGETCTLHYTGGADEIEDAAGNDLAAFSGHAVTNSSAQDGTAPTLSSVVVSDATHTIFTFSEAVTESGTGSDWALTLSGGAVTLSSPSVVGSTITYSNSRSVASSETLSDLDYTQPGNGIEDAAGNDLASISNYAGSFTNSVPSNEDIVDPVVTITSPETNPYTSASQNITVSGTASDNVGVSSVTIACPTCQSVGAVTGTTSWSVPIVLSQGTVTVDLLLGAGAFSEEGTWYMSSAWAIADGVATSAGGQLNSYLEHTFYKSLSDTYTVSYTVSGSVSGDLYLSQWGFGGATTLLDTSAGAHTVDVVCAYTDRDLLFVGNPWTGILDSVTVVKSGGTGPVYNVITVTATDAAANTGTDEISIGFTPPTSTPARVMGLGGHVKIDIGDGVQLEF